MSKVISTILIAAFIVAIVLTIQPVTAALGNLINNRAINDSIAATTANRLNEAQVNYAVTELEMRRQILPLTVQLKFAAVLIVVAILIVPTSLIYVAFVRKLFIAVANPRNPWITVQTQVAASSPAETRPAGSRQQNDRLFYQSVSRLYTQVRNNPNLPAGEKQVILAYLTQLLRDPLRHKPAPGVLRDRRATGRTAIEVDPYSFDYE